MAASARGWGVMRRVGGMVVAPRKTLQHILLGHGDALEVVALALLVVTACYPMTVARYALLVHVDPGMALQKLFGSNGFFWTRLMNQTGFCAVASAGFFGLGWMLKKPVAVWTALTAGFYLYVPMGLLALVGLVLDKMGLVWPWLPHHPLDGWWVLEGNRVHLERFYAKLVLEMTWPAMVGLAAAWQWAHVPPSPPSPSPSPPPATPSP